MNIYDEIGKHKRRDVDSAILQVQKQKLSIVDCFLGSGGSSVLGAE